MRTKEPHIYKSNEDIIVCSYVTATIQCIFFFSGLQNSQRNWRIRINENGALSICFFLWILQYGEILFCCCVVVFWIFLWHKKVKCYNISLFAGCDNNRFKTAAGMYCAFCSVVNLSLFFIYCWYLAFQQQNYWMICNLYINSPLGRIY